jgi:predicted sugar kinase
MGGMSQQILFHRQAFVQTGSRLHFGLIRIGKAHLRYGGLGVMIEEPKLEITVRPAEQWSCTGDFGDRLLPFAQDFFAEHFASEAHFPAMGVERS